LPVPGAGKLSDVALTMPRERRRKKKHGAGYWAYLVSATALAVVFVFPLVWAVLRSFQPPNLASAVPQRGDFTHLTLANYRAVFAKEHILHNVVNSLVAGLGTALLTMVVATLAGYGLAKFRFRGAGVVFGLILLALMIPFQAVLTPLFIELNYLHLTNSILGLIFVYATFNLPFGVFVMRNSFEQIPREIVESAEVDGAGPMMTLLSVLRPLIIPGLATTAIYAFLYSWNEFLQALTFLQSDGKLTLPVKLFNIDTSTYGAINYGYLSSGIVIAMVPCVVLYFSLQRYYVQGLMSGAIKG
jgi:multiple sugar transport system permease protein